MATTYDLLSTHGAQVASTAGALYTVPSSTTSYVKKIILLNTNTSSENVMLYVVENGGSVGDARKILDIDLASNETFDWSLDFPICLATAGDTIQGVTDTASKVNCLIFGREDA